MLGYVPIVDIIQITNGKIYFYDHYNQIAYIA